MGSIKDSTTQSYEMMISGAAQRHPERTSCVWADEDSPWQRVAPHACPSHFTTPGGAGILLKASSGFVYACEL